VGGGRGTGRTYRESIEAGEWIAGLTRGREKKDNTTDTKREPDAAGAQRHIVDKRKKRSNQLFIRETRPKQRNGTSSGKKKRHKSALSEHRGKKEGPYESADPLRRNYRERDFTTSSHKKKGRSATVGLRRRMT